MTDTAITESHSLILVEDDDELASLIQDYLNRHGFNVTTISDGLVAEVEILRQQPDITILDIMLPGQTGMEVCRKVRDRYQGPILMLTALDEDMDQLLGLEIGADDYIIKPVHPRLLLSRLRALLRRMKRQLIHATTTTNSSLNTLNLDSLIINLSNRSVILAEQSIALTTSEFELLLMLAEDIGQPVSRDSIVQQLRGFDYDGMDRSIDRRISRLRKKLQAVVPTQEIIKTIRGKGYQLCPIRIDDD